MTIPRPFQAARRSPGFTLIEVMIALVVLLVGLLGLARLQVVGMQVNQASRAHTVAAQLAQELAGGLQRLDWDDGQVAPTGVVGSAPPPVFGTLLASVGSGSYHSWSDSTPVPGVRLDSAITERDADGTPTFKRRWTVWGVADGTGRPYGGRLIAVSVIFHERASSIPFEVVYYVSQGNAGVAMANAAAYQ